MFLILVLGLSSAAGVLSQANPAINVPATLQIVNKQISPDGFQRPTVLAGGVYPAPLIRLNNNKEFDVTVVNKLHNTVMDTNTSIHWHGLFQHSTNWADGVVGVTQCPIPPSDQFQYKFGLGDQVGTYWYHSHLSTQYCDGLRGPIVIDDPNDPYVKNKSYDVDNENTVITLSDWYHTPSPKQVIPAVADSILINGLGRYPGGPNSTLAVVNVAHGKRYRFRLLSLSCDPNFQFSIDGHTFEIIEADGGYTKPLVVDTIHIFAGQRYSFIMTANQTVGNYWIRALPNVGPTGFANGINSAILRYKGAKAVNPTTKEGSHTNPLVETNLHPLVSSPVPGNPVPGGADISINIAATFNTTLNMFTVNGLPWVYDYPLPVLLQILRGATNVNQLFPNVTYFGLAPNKSVEITLPAGAAGGPHPIHLHGHAFHVVRSAGNSSYNFVDPVVRDVVSMGDTGDVVTIRFQTDNPGPWFLHCHIDWHLQLGFAVALIEDITGIKNADPVPAEWTQLNKNPC
ncbi:yellow laccase [Artomyces pyxidatus]|uniref:Yellow laccase n=1 Tax=Artomyces pyxidatus TaxID=48021 RepID=A0ACB8SZZ1_9AGAM|nr:yellow laccase [Artomyces pyxidatus]